MSEVSLHGYITYQTENKHILFFGEQPKLRLNENSASWYTFYGYDGIATCEEYMKLCEFPCAKVTVHISDHEYADGIESHPAWLYKDADGNIRMTAHTDTPNYYTKSSKTIQGIDPDRKHSTPPFDPKMFKDMTGWTNGTLLVYFYTEMLPEQGIDRIRIQSRLSAEKFEKIKEEIKYVVKEFRYDEYNAEGDIICKKANSTGESWTNTGF